MPSTHDVSGADSNPVKTCVLNTPQPMMKYNNRTVKYLQFEAYD